MWRGIELTTAHPTVSAFTLAYRSMLLPYLAVTELADLETIRKINMAENDLILWSTGLLDARKFFTPPILNTMRAVPELRDYALTWERDERAADDAARERQARCEATRREVRDAAHARATARAEERETRKCARGISYTGSDVIEHDSDADSSFKAGGDDSGSDEECSTSSGVGPRVRRTPFNDRSRGRSLKRGAPAARRGKYGILTNMSFRFERGDEQLHTMRLRHDGSMEFMDQTDPVDMAMTVASFRLGDRTEVTLPPIDCLTSSIVDDGKSHAALPMRMEQLTASSGIVHSMSDADAVDMAYTELEGSWSPREQYWVRVSASAPDASVDPVGSPTVAPVMGFQMEAQEPEAFDIHAAFASTELDAVENIGQLLKAAEVLQADLNEVVWGFVRDDQPRACLIEVTMKQRGFPSRVDTLTVHRGLIGVATPEDKETLAFATAFVRRDGHVVDLTRPVSVKRTAKNVMSAAAQFLQSSPNVCVEDVGAQRDTCSVTIAQLRHAQPEFVARFEPLVATRSRAAAVRYEKRRARDGVPIKWYIQHTVYDKTLNRQPQARHGQFYDETVAQLLATWLMSQCPQLRSTGNVARIFVGLLVPPSLVTSDIGKSIDVQCDETDTWRLMVDGVERDVEWGAATPTVPLSGTLARVHKGRQQTLISGYMEDVFIETFEGTKMTVVKIPNPLSKVIPMFEEAQSALHDQLLGSSSQALPRGDGDQDLASHAPDVAALEEEVSTLSDQEGGGELADGLGDPSGDLLGMWGAGL
tara:strand:- start:4047 stop:6335 length:2289 start_codon:yes stop_codon:yes gene_type:complete